MSALNSFGDKTCKLLLVLVAGVCLAAGGLYPQDTSTATSARKPVSPSSAGSTQSSPSHPVVKKAGTPAPTPGTATSSRAVPHASAGQPPMKKATPQASPASAVKTTPNHATAHTSQRASSPARRWRPRTLNGWERLARLRLQPQRIQEIQQALIREGYLREDANGQWDSQTHDAMLHYQTDHGFPATGLPEAKSLMKLGLGSHPLPPELDHSPVGGAGSGAGQGGLTVTSPLPPVSQATPPSQVPSPPPPK